MPWICGSITLETYVHTHTCTHETTLKIPNCKWVKTTFIWEIQLMLSLFNGFLAFSTFMTSNRIYPKSKSLSRWFFFVAKDHVYTWWRYRLKFYPCLVFTNDLSSIVQNHVSFTLIRSPDLFLFTLLCMGMVVCIVFIIVGIKWRLLLCVIYVASFWFVCNK